MGMERHCHSDAQFPRCLAKLTETFVTDGRCETAAALLARPPLSFRTTPQAPKPIWKAPATRHYNRYFEAAIAR